MIELAARYQGRLEIIGVSMDDAPADEVQKFAHDMKVNYPVIMGGNAMSQEYGGVPVLPTSFVIRPDGAVVQKHVGLYPIGTYDAEVRSLLGMPVSAKVETFEDTGQIFLKNAVHATELPGVSFKGLTAAQKTLALKRMNTEPCVCGCGLTIAECRINDPACDVSPSLAQKIIHDVRLGVHSSPRIRPRVPLDLLYPVSFDRKVAEVARWDASEDTARTGISWLAARTGRGRERSGTGLSNSGILTRRRIRAAV